VLNSALSYELVSDVCDPRSFEKPHLKNSEGILDPVPGSSRPAVEAVSLGVDRASFAHFGASAGCEKKNKMEREVTRNPLRWASRVALLAVCMTSAGIESLLTCGDINCAVAT